MKVICFGDSNTYGYDPRSYIGDRYTSENRWVDILAEKTGWNILNEGLNGRVIPTKSIKVPSDTDLLIVMLGTNDVFFQDDPAIIAKSLGAFLSEINIQKNQILLVAPPPVESGQWGNSPSAIQTSKSLASHYETLALRLQIRFANAGDWNIAMAFDGVHFTEEGHKTFADNLYQYLNKGEI